MKTTRKLKDPAADEQAALWAARIDGDPLDRAQRAELDGWLAQNPENRVLLSRYCQFSADLEEQIPALVAARRPAWSENAVTVVRPSRRRTFPRVASIALAAAAAVALIVTLVRPAQPVQNVATSPGQRQTITLADGTRLELNAQTSLRFENAGHERRVRLAAGEALFMVAKDPSRPFIVETPAGSVRVTGTTFNVRTEPAAKDFEVTVLEGSVQVRPGAVGGGTSSAVLALGAGDQFSMLAGRASQQLLSASELDDALAWRQGQIVFRDVPLREAAARFARFHGRAVNVSDRVAGFPIGGRHSIDDLSGFLASLEQVLEVKVTYDLNGAVTIAAVPGK